MEEAIKQIGDRLRGLRESLDLTTDEVAKAAGVTKEKYELMEAGETELSVSTASKDSQGLQCRARRSDVR